MTAVENRQQAVDAALTGQFDLAILDITMPVLDGLSAAKAIEEELPAIRIALHTAMDEGWVRDRFTGHDADWPKPLHNEAFLAN